MEVNSGRENLSQVSPVISSSFFNSAVMIHVQRCAPKEFITPKNLVLTVKKLCLVQNRQVVYSK
jgi:hypothetical protein